MRRTWFFPVVSLILAVGPAFTPLASQAPAPVVQRQDYASLIGAFPPAGSDGAKADLAILLWQQRSRTPAEVRRAETEVILHLGIFSEVTGKDLDSGPFPRTRALADDLQAALRQVTAPLKVQFARPRPYDAFHQIKPAVKLEPSFSYPSGHASWGMVQATLLAALQPQRREAILERGRLVGYDRVLAGVHYPSDVDAGQLLGPAFAQSWLAAPANHKRLEEARSEW
jgi:acid phosphatase (class A)